MTNQLCLGKDDKVVILSILKQRIVMLRSQRTDCNYIKFFCDKIRQLMQLVHPIEREQWHKKVQEFDRLEEKILCATMETYEKIRRMLAKKNLLNSDPIKKHICRIESIWSFKPEKKDASEIKNHDGTTSFFCKLCGEDKQSHRPYIFPSYARGLYDEVCRLCDATLDVGEVEAIQEFVEIKELEEWQELSSRIQHYYCIGCKCHYEFILPNKENDDVEFVCQQCQRSDSLFLEHKGTFRKTRKIVAFTFAPQVYELLELEKTISFDDDMPIWIASNVLDSLEWSGLEKTRDLFRKKRLCIITA